MFEKLKQFKDLRDQAKKLQGMMAGQSATAEKNGVKITVNGQLEVISIELPENLEKSKMEAALKDCFNEAVKNMQKSMAMAMQKMGGFPGM